MIIKMLTTMAGPKGVALPGDEIDVSEKQAIDLVSGGYAVYTKKTRVDPIKEQPIETATIEQPKETTAKKTIIRKRKP